MKPNHAWRSRLAKLLIGAAIVIALLVIREAKAGNEPIHLVTDWSHRHVVFSKPTSLMKRFQLSSDHRYVQQWLRRNAEKRGDRDEWRWRRAPENPNLIKGDWSMDMGAGATVGAGNYPAKYSFDASAASCANDFVVYNTGLGGSSSQATLVAFNDIYAGTCTTPNPSTYWAYNTGSGAIVTSPILSYDGTQIAFVQNTAGASNLVVLRWKASNGTLAAPVTPGTGPCLPAAAPCQTTVALSTATVALAAPSATPFTCTGVDSHSSPFYDYGHDVLYVGDDSGCLHKFTGIFFGTPTEVTSSGANVWPAALTGGFGHLNSPVYANGHGQVLVTGTDGVLYSVDTTIGGVYPGGANFTPKLAGTGFDDGPLVDLSGAFLYVFARADNASNQASIFQFTIPASPSALHNNSGTEEIVTDAGAANPASAFYVGSFDDPYFSSGNASGDLYVCSTHNTGTTTVNAIWVISMTAGAMSSPNLGPSLTTANVGCSPITEFNDPNANRDLMFLSVANNAITADLQIKCPSASGCVMSFNIGSILAPTSATAATATEAGGTSGIVIDNYASSTTGSEQVYFTPLSDQSCAGAGGVGTGTGGCAIQASQTTLN